MDLYIGALVVIGKVLDKIYKTILLKIINYVNEPKELIRMDEVIKDYILLDRREKLIDRLFSLFSEDYFEKIFQERYFIVDENLSVTLIHNYSTDRIIEEIYNKGIEKVLSIIRTWPTIPPHIHLKDLRLADELNALSIGAVVKRGIEVHILLMKAKHAWRECFDVRNRVSRKLFEKADSLVLVMRNGYEEIEEFDSFNIGDKVMNLYPEIADEHNWRDAINLMTSNYLKLIEFPQYFFVKLV